MRVTDEDVREQERRYKASGDPQDLEVLHVHGYCPQGLHEFSPWGPVLRFSWGVPGNPHPHGEQPIILGHGRGEPVAFNVSPGYRTVLVRVCFWCFQTEHKRVEGQKAPWGLEIDVARLVCVRELDAAEVELNASKAIEHGRVGEILSVTGEWAQVDVTVMVKGRGRLWIRSGDNRPPNWVEVDSPDNFSSYAFRVSNVHSPRLMARAEQ